MKKYLLCLFLTFSVLTTIQAEEKISKETTTTIETKKESSTLNLREVYSASPIIYSILLTMSVGSVAIWLYSLLTFRIKNILKQNIVEELKEKLAKKKYNEALVFLDEHETNILSKIMKSAILARSEGLSHISESMKSEGRRATAYIWQRISLLNDVVLIAPMLGLLGTVLGMFYAFYDINRSVDSLSSLFDGLGIAVGTTVAGLIVAIIAMVFYTTLKYRLISTLNLVENEATSLSKLINKK